MLFATTTLARRIDLAESRLCAAFAELERSRTPDTFVEPLGGTTAIYAGPGKPFNKVAGLGLAAELVESDLERVEELYRRHNSPLQVELSTLADHAVASLLTRRGYVLVNFENVLGIALDQTFVDDATAKLREDEARGLTMRRIDAQNTREWIDTMTTAFAHADTFDGPPSHEHFERDVVEQAMMDWTRIDGSVGYLAYRDGVTAGAGTLRLDSGLAQLSGAATLPEHRRRGIQTMLLRARLVDAARNGCDLATVTTQPASKSQENVQRAGFSLLYPRAVLVRDLSAEARGAKAEPS
jgi:ribosomal protein S18 acetylase RimI-like enzyme